VPENTTWPLTRMTAQSARSSRVTIVLVDDYRGQTLLAQAADHAPDFLAHQGREPLGGLVENQHVGIGHQRPADGQHLLLAAGQPVAEMVKPLGQARKQIEHRF